MTARDMSQEDFEGLEYSHRMRFANAQFAALYTEPVKVNAWPAYSLITFAVVVCITVGYFGPILLRSFS